MEMRSKRGCTSSTWLHISSGEYNVDRSCLVIWSAVGVVRPAWFFGVVCLSQCYDSLFAYSFLGCFEMLTLLRLGRHFPLLFIRSGWRTQCVDEAVAWPVICSFISIAVFRLDLNGFVDSDAVFNFLLHCWKIETRSKSSRAVHSVSWLLSSVGWGIPNSHNSPNHFPN